MRSEAFALALMASFACAASASSAPYGWRMAEVGTVDGLADVRLDRQTGQVIVYGADSRFRLSAKDSGYVLTPLPSAPSSEIEADTIPHSRIATGTGVIAHAWLAEPTRRYQHGVLGDDVEAGALKVRLRDGSVASLRLPEDSVFEDLQPRIVALDGKEAVLVVRSYLDAGAAIATYRIEEGQIVPLAESDPIGLSHRWLNPVGAADFDGDGVAEIAAVVTPHLSGDLTLYEREGVRLVRKISRGGYATHFIGSTVLGMSVIADMNRDGVPDIVLPSLGRDRLAVASFAGGSGRELFSLPQPSVIVTAIVAADLGGTGALEIVFGRKDGTLAVIRR